VDSHEIKAVNVLIPFYSVFYVPTLGRLLLFAVCVPAGKLLSYWNRPFFPAQCADPDLNDKVIYDTMVRIGGTFNGVAEAFKVVTNMYIWKHIVLVSNSESKSVCWYGMKPFEAVLSSEENYTITWFRLGSDAKDKQIDSILQEIRSRTRGLLKL